MPESKAALVYSADTPRSTRPPAIDPTQSSTTFRRRTLMTKCSLVRLMLIAMLASGCAMHTPTAPIDARPVGTDDKVGAVAANMWYVPSRALLCGVGATISAVVMTVTLGQAYDSASELMHGGCSGPWLVHPEDIRQAVP